MDPDHPPPEVEDIRGILCVCGLEEPEYMEHPVISPIRVCVSSIMRRRARIFSQMINQFPILSTTGIERVGVGMLQMNADGNMNWGRGLALLALACTVVRRVSGSRLLTEFALRVLPLYVYQAIGPNWFHAHGGWNGLRMYCRQFMEQQGNMRMFLLLTAAGLVATVMALWLSSRQGPLG
ncbi:apoptosis regulator G16 [Colobine gammaherpesvirus 1]|uniref:Apoptosis regulator G16 n=1 Tax=Colobine gammaherpesvirus 1 TaxID=2597325 RepID=A0A5B8FKL5_9GAMA|nr:apoptosis regulator G16 [Colobine gammaherpesvirus 1]QDQ69223.1 apoptosis regulator G16 [Colobine gammaherpesvirus 1]